MKIVRTSPGRFRDRLLRGIDRGEVVLLAGAGLSMVAPTVLPSGSALKDTILSALCDSPELKRYLRVIRRLREYEQIVPEVVFERLFEILGERLFPVFDLLRHAEPNTAHAVLAHLAEARGLQVCTTNFDLLIEAASARTTGRPLHLHGDLDHREQLVIRINAVGRGVTPALQHIFRRRVKGKVLCVLGYSGNDQDVRLLLRSSGARRLQWLVRGTADPAWRNFRYLDDWDISCDVASGDLARLAEDLASRYSIVKSRCRGQRHDAARRRAVSAWHSSLTLAERFACVSKLLLDLEHYSLAAEAADEGHRYGRRDGWGCWFRNQASWAARMVGDFATMARRGRQGLALSVEERNSYEEAHASSQLGLWRLEGRHPDAKGAEPFFRQAIKAMRLAARSATDRHRREQTYLSLAQFYNNLGLALSHRGRVRQAIQAYRNSLALKRRFGALLGVAQTSVNMCIVHYGARQWGEANRWKRKAEALIGRYGLRFQEAYLTRELGSMAASQGRLRIAEARLERALGIYRRIHGSEFGIELTTDLLNGVRERIGAKSVP